MPVTANNLQGQQQASVEENFPQQPNFRVAVELNRSSDMSMSRTQLKDGSRQAQPEKHSNNEALKPKNDHFVHSESKRKFEGVKSLTQSQDDLDKVGMATTTSFNTTAKFRTINFQRGANGTHTHVIEAT